MTTIKTFPVKIIPYLSVYKDQVARLITGIQQGEFGVPITIDDQPDLLNIETFYQIKKGNFWCAVVGNDVVGTIALIDMGDGSGCIRKMFVRADYRGHQHQTAHKLHSTLLDWCKQAQIGQLYLGTLNYLHAAIKFYGKLGYAAIDPVELPATFPRMALDNRFFTTKV